MDYIGSGDKAPTDLSATITQEQLISASFCGLGGFGEVSWLDHPSLGNIAIKRLLVSTPGRTSTDQRRVRY